MMPEEQDRSSLTLIRKITAIAGACLLLGGCLADTSPQQAAMERSTPGVHTDGGPSQLQDVSNREAPALNTLRARHGLAPLGTDPTLTRIARGHAEDMTRNRFFGHVSSDGRTIADRTRQANYRYCHVAENLAMGQGSFEEVLDQWMNSPSHRRNLMQRNVDDFGLVHGPGNLWVLVLGRPGC